ncbi:MAG: PspA/IM30 family protein [SAR324 cluster bacterium]|jgi:phage shock protein A|nr:PspA/IM30 family protein [SAR324 cluster bacterium]HIM43959.1 PspA/IM30 family protein [Deltaproteobacteria bacterium]MEC7757996.1 PspA/IM30 family protein [SAR324 cluster bacterium]MEC8971744.1 PspA/IM30 family protein [SAR324 cluster bacterium]MEC9220664.1 PspA/IM30 family protein [SAR324 cluster bacterium]|tara:strand:+ start:1343 stop:2053 length:711 start_codon:yes stop_codon:yes gene_type:complete
MGIISRLFNLFRANANDMLDKAEDPEKMLQQMLSDLEVQKQKAKKQMTEALALQKRLERDTEKEHKEAEKWEQKAILAVQNEKDDLAKEALTRKKEFTIRAADYEKQLEMHRNNADALRSSYQTLEDKIDEIKRKKGILSVKQKQAEAQENIYQTMEGLGDTSGTMETIARIEEKVENMQTRAEAYQEISMESDKDSLESKFEELEHDSSDMELELLELKKRAALPAPDEESDKKE